MNPTDEQLLAELRHLNTQLAALRQVAEGPMLAELLDIFIDMRQMCASLAGFRVTGATRPRPMPEVNQERWGVEETPAPLGGVAKSGDA